MLVIPIATPTSAALALRPMKEERERRTVEDRDNLRWTGCKVDTGCPRGCPSPPQYDGGGRVGGWQDHWVGTGIWSVGLWNYIGEMGRGRPSAG